MKKSSQNSLFPIELFNMTCHQTFYWNSGTTWNFFTNLVQIAAELQKAVTKTLVGVLTPLHFEYSPKNKVYSFFWSWVYNAWIFSQSSSFILTEGVIPHYSSDTDAVQIKRESAMSRDDGSTQISHWIPKKLIQLSHLGGSSSHAIVYIAEYVRYQSSGKGTCVIVKFTWQKLGGIKPFTSPWKLWRPNVQRNWWKHNFCLGLN